MEKGIKDLEGEIWKDIDFIEEIPVGLYQVSNKARIKSLAKEWVSGKNEVTTRSKPDTILCTETNSKYHCVTLSYKRKAKKVKVHRLVAIAFIPNPENKPCINHKDGDKLNNSIENLEWVTYKENRQHAIDTGLAAMGKDHPKAKSIIDTETGIFYECLREASYALLIKYSTLRAMLNGNNKNRTSLRYC